MQTQEIRYTKKNGEVAYWASYQTAWNNAIKLNETAVNGLWYFEADLNGWYLYWVSDNND